MSFQIAMAAYITVLIGLSAAVTRAPAPNSQQGASVTLTLTLVVLAVALGAMLPGYIHGWMVPASGWAYADNRPLGVMGRLAQLAGAVAGFWIVVRGMVIFQWIAGSLAVAFIAAWLGHWLVFG